MGADETAEYFLDDKLQTEIGALLWIDPFLNNGVWDGGWSCRDHVVVLGHLLAERGIASTVRHGRSAFVQGSTPELDPCGYWQDLSFPSKCHSWLYVPGFGDLDLSPRLDRRLSTWRPIDGKGVVGGVWQVNPPAEVDLVHSRRDFEIAFADASFVENANVAVYLVEDEEPFTSEISRDGLRWANSPLSTRLGRRGSPPDLYERGARHLLRLGDRRSLSGVSQLKAWRLIATAPELSGD